MGVLAEEPPRDEALTEGRAQPRGMTPARCGRQGRHSNPREPVMRKGGLV